MASSSQGQASDAGAGKGSLRCLHSPDRVQLRETLGNDGLVELDAALDEVGQHGRRTFWKSPPIGSSVALVIELSQFRVEMAREFAAVRVEISTSRLSTIRWVAGLLIALAGVIIASAFALMTFLANVLKAN